VAHGADIANNPNPVAYFVDKEQAWGVARVRPEAVTADGLNGLNLAEFSRHETGRIATCSPDGL